MDKEAVEAFFDRISGPAAETFNTVVAEQARLGWVYFVVGIALLIAGVFLFRASMKIWKVAGNAGFDNEMMPFMAAMVMTIVSGVLFILVIVFVSDGLSHVSAPYSEAIETLLK